MLKKIIKKIIPISCFNFLKKIRFLFERHIFSLFYNKKKKKCSFCLRSFSNFTPAGAKEVVLKEKKVVGGGYRLNVKCPYCGSRDRERLVHLFLIKGKKLLFKNMKFLHIAPEKNLQKFLKKKKVDYLSADLGDIVTDIKMDIQDIKFPDKYFDAIICNHVLEHIIDDKKAIGELYRVLKPNGWAILQVPYSLTSETFEDFSVVREEERTRMFGQKDHPQFTFEAEHPRMKKL